MIKTLIEKELKQIIFSPKFTATFIICSTLIILSIIVGLMEYNTVSDQYNSSKILIDQKLKEDALEGKMSNRVIRKPNPVQIFANGVNYDIGRYSRIDATSSIKLESSSYSEETIFALFRIIDFSFITRFVLSLFALMFTFNAVSGEKEAGTLKLIFANSVSRAQVIIAKCTGAWIGMVLAVSVPVLLGLFILAISGIPFEQETVLKIITIIGFSFLVFTFFIFFGVMVSSLTKNSSLSFLICLVCWIVFVFIIPRAGVLAANQIVSVPGIAEIEGQKARYYQNKWAEFNKESGERWKEHGGKESCGSVSDSKMWEWLKSEDQERSNIEKEIVAYEQDLLDDLRRKQAARERLALSLSRISPSASYQFAILKLAGTDIGLKARTEDQMTRYKTDFVEYAEDKNFSLNGKKTMMISLSTQSGVSAKSYQDDTEIDISDMPVFDTQEASYASVLSDSAIDFGLLWLYTIIAFAISFISFLKYDLR